MKSFPRLLGMTALIIVVLFALCAGFVYSGLYNIAATQGHSRPLAQVFRLVMMRSVVAHARGISPPANFNPQDHTLAEKGASHYAEMCRTCHGAPGKKPDPWQLYPPVPDLADALRITRWSDSEIFWIIKNGIKDTGMSAFGQSHDDEELWALTAFVRQLGTLSPDQYRTMSEQAAMKEAHGHEERGDEKARMSDPKAKADPLHQH